MKDLNAEIIAVGTELLLGQIANTNAKWLSEELALIGVNTFYHSVVGDNLNRLVNVFKTAQTRSNLIITMGGLGPTTDDLTREGFQKISNLPLVEEPNAMAKIESFFLAQQTPMSENNRRQARIFQGARIIENKLGMAPGMIVEYGESIWIFLPGVPREMKQMVTDSVLPYLQEQNGSEMIIQSRVLRLIGIGESSLEEKLVDLIDEQTNPTLALLAQNDGNIIRLTAKAPSKKEAKQLLDEYEKKIEQRVGSFIYGRGEGTIAETIFHLLKSKGMRISAAESLTGGMFTKRLIDLPGASDIIPGSIVAYDAKVKQELLQVPKEIIENYGTVSEACARQMAENIARINQTDFGIAFTGVAGPDSSEGQPPGRVYIAIYHQQLGTIIKKASFTGDRYMIRQRSVLKGFEMLLKILKNEF